jgi:alkylation response protein AidB-like acyl-CoA dehydrogenase
VSSTTVPAKEPVDVLEERFGASADPANPVGTAAVLAADRRGELLAAGEDLLDEAGLGAHFVPTELGGRFDGLEGLITVLRAVVRRDPALALGYGVSSFMAGVNVWTAGNEAQREDLARRLVRGAKVACAYHELAHGNDFTRAELAAAPGPDGQLRLEGRKEVVANLRRAEALVLFARTDPAPGGRSHSLLLLDAARLPADRVRRLERFGTTGMRGVPLGGIEFTDCPAPADSVVGVPGQGVRTALRSFQLTRITLPGMAIGLVDSALRSALRVSPPGAYREGDAGQRVLAEVFADLLLADVFSTVAARCLQTAPALGSVYASAVKALVPAVLIDAVYRLSILLGPRSVLSAGDRGAAFFEKLLRDVKPTAFGHASRVSCLSLLLAQINGTARRSWPTGHSAAPSTGLPPETFLPRQPLPALRFEPLAVVSRGADPLSASLLAGAADHAADAGDPLERRIAAQAAAYVAELRDLAAFAASLPPDEQGPTASAPAFALAARWTGVLAASACLNTWWHGRAEAGCGGGFAEDPAWLLGAVHRLGAHLGRHRDPLPAEFAAPLYAELARRFAEGLTFDLDRRPTGA